MTPVQRDYLAEANASMARAEAELARIDEALARLRAELEATATLWIGPPPPPARKP